LRKLIISMRTRRKLQTMLQKPTLPGIQLFPQQRLSNLDSLKTKRSLISQLTQRRSKQPWCLFTQQLLVSASFGGRQYSQPPPPRPSSPTSSYAHPVCHQAPSTYSTNEAPNTMPSSLLGPAHSTSPHQYAWHTREPTPQTPYRPQRATPYHLQ